MGEYLLCLLDMADRYEAMGCIEASKKIRVQIAKCIKERQELRQG